jgi:hypothetical protein
MAVDLEFEHTPCLLKRTAGVVTVPVREGEDDVM